MTMRKYPIGIQTFSEIIRDGYVYVDKTDLVWQMAHYAKYVFLTRPRRFGKSLLTSTLNAYFSGERELFERLKIMQLEQEWRKYPVLRLDLSGAKHLSPALVQKELERILEPYEQVYGKRDSEVTPGMRLAGIIMRAYEQSKERVVVLIDEYDAPLLDVLHEEEELKEMREVMQEFYQRLKMLDPYIKFCFITGITKFSQLSSHTPIRTHGWTFSTINNIMNVTMDVKFGAICGVTELELVTALKEDIGRLAMAYDTDWETMHQKLKLRYDGYRFTKAPVEIYNPYSLIKAFQAQELSSYWFESGTPTFLIRQMQYFRTDITSLDRLEVPSSAFDQPTENMDDALPLLYQSGYLTIKDYNSEAESYTLSIPNQEVRIGYTQGLLPAYIGLKSSDVQMGFAYKFWKALKKSDINQAMQEMQSYMASIPYVEGFKEKLKDAATKEGFYEYTMYLIFSMLNVYVRTQVKCAGGRIDLVVDMPDAVYVFELKVNDTAENALRQIDDKGYAIPYQNCNSKVVKVGVKICSDNRTIEDWVIAE